MANRKKTKPAQDFKVAPNNQSFKLTPTAESYKEGKRANGLIDRLDRFHKTHSGYATFAVIELVLAYIFISWAIDSGSWFDYLFTLLFTVGFLQNTIKLIGSFFGSTKIAQGKRS